ncbi:MAG: hypothetical protein ACOC5T_04505 [Elusimicrobiota bacterium]
MSNKSYQKGYRFQRRVKKYLEKRGWNVLVRPRSKFPDLHCWKKEGIFNAGLYNIMEVECKMNKYLSKSEKKRGKAIVKQGVPFFIAWKDKKRKIRIYEYEPK